MLAGKCFILELCHQTISSEKRLGDHLLVPPVRDLTEQSVQSEFPLQHLVEGALEHDGTRVFRIVDHGLL